MNNQIINISEDINAFPLPRKVFYGKLLGITETIYLDTDIVRLTDNQVDLFSPSEKIKYEFLIEQMINKKNKYCIVTISEYSIYYNSEPVNRCKVELTTDISPENMNFLRKNAKYSCDKRIIRFKRNCENGLHKYDIFISSEYIGFVSEFGNYEEYSKDSCGMMNFSLSDCSLLTRNKNCDTMQSHLAPQSRYGNYINNKFVLNLPFTDDVCLRRTILSLNTMSVENYFIAGVSSDDEYYLIRDRLDPDECNYLQVNTKDCTITPVKIINPCTNIFQSILTNDYSPDPILREFDTAHYLCDLSFSVMRGFTLKKSKEIDGFYAMFIINGKKSKFHIYNSK